MTSATQQTSTEQTDVSQGADPGGPDVVEIPWSELADAVTASGDGVFLATTGRDGRPHVTWVMPGWSEERMWIAVFADSQKAANMRHCAYTAMTCPANPSTNVIIRATARLVTEPAENSELWKCGVLPYDPNMFFSGPDDPRLQFVELLPTHASVRALGPGPIRRWHRAA